MRPNRLTLEKTTFTIAGVMALGIDTKLTGARERLFVDGVEITPGESLAVANYSPSGFAWGYSGRGADQTALAICLHIFQNPTLAETIYPDFKVEFVQQWPLAQPFNQLIDIADFLLDHWPIVSQAYCLSHIHPEKYET